MGHHVGEMTAGYVALVMALSFVCGALTAGIVVYVWMRPDTVEELEELEEDEVPRPDPMLFLHAPSKLPSDLPNGVVSPVAPPPYPKF